MTDRRFIEESFPVKEVSEAAAKEKNIRQGHISTLHVWWARRPLAASVATTYAALTSVTDRVDEWQHRRNLMAQMSRWENSTNVRLLETAHEEIVANYHGQPPRVLDPFAGGGSYPLAALQLGCQTYAMDYNPVSVLVLKATLQYPRQFGRLAQTNSSVNEVDGLFGAEGISAMRNTLADSVSKWGRWVLQEAHEELTDYYPEEAGGHIAMGYIWARTIPCQNPSCGSEIPLMRQYWLAKTDKKRITLYPHEANGKLLFEIVGDGYAPWPSDFNPDHGTVVNAVATCPHCGTVIDDKTTRRLFQEGYAGQRMVAVVLYHPQHSGKTFRVATESDDESYRLCIGTLEEKRDRLMSEWGLDPIPDEPIPLMSGTFNAPIYGMNKWGDLYNVRQKLAMITFVDKVRQAHQLMAGEVEPELATAISTYLAILVDRIADFTATLCQWENTRGNIKHVFTRAALPMLWDYIEANPFSAASGSAREQLDTILRVITHLSYELGEQTLDSAYASNAYPAVTQASATQLPYEDDYFDAVLTDPPYYNSVPYADLSDFFYVWLKRTAGNLYPELFATPLTPKDREITEMAGWDPVRYAYKDKAFFETNLKQAFLEIYRVLKPDGIAVIVYAHKSTAGWETVINALLDCRLVITGAWPINTEMRSRLRANESAALASSIYIVARKIARRATGFYNEVRNELRQHLNAKLHRLWEEGISGADFFIAAIGSAIEIFGKYEQVLDYEGNVVRADRLLQEVRTIATDYAVRQILHDGFAGQISDLTRFYLLWRWDYGDAKVPFDEARKLAQSCGLDLAREWDKGGFIKKDKEFVLVLGPQARKQDSLETSHEMIDVLHRVLLLWEKGQRSELVTALAASGYGRNDVFYRVAQAISETLQNESKEKKLLDGFLAGRGRVRDEVEQITTQRTLWQE